MTSSGQLSNRQWIQLLQIFSARFVTEVMGGAGAVWSFFEALGVRNDTNSISFWKPLALWTGFIFFCRWVFQIQAFIQESRERTEAEKQQDKGGPGPLMYDFGEKICEMSSY